MSDTIVAGPAEPVHSPGPLTVIVERTAFKSYDFFAADIRDANDKRVALVVEGPILYADGEMDGEASRARDAANAHLFGAAPDLLASLVEFRDHLVRGARFGINDDERAMLVRADVAIAKAKAVPQ